MVLSCHRVATHQALVYLSFGEINRVGYLIDPRNAVFIIRVAVLRHLFHCRTSVEVQRLHLGKILADLVVGLLLGIGPGVAEPLEDVTEDGGHQRWCFLQERLLRWSLLRLSHLLWLG